MVYFKFQGLLRELHFFGFNKNAHTQKGQKDSDTYFHLKFPHGKRDFSAGAHVQRSLLGEAGRLLQD
jgi:hypothetical protein